MKLRIVLLTVVALACFVAFQGTAQAAATTDPCAGTGLKCSAAITGATELLVPFTSGETVYVCGFALGSSSSGGSVQFTDETNKGCGTTALTGSMELSSTAPLVVGNNQHLVRDRCWQWIVRY
jgi:hypothetical protein